MCALSLLALWGCGDASEGVLLDPVAEQIIGVEASLVDETIVAGGALVVEIDGASAIVPASARVILTGDIDGRPVEANMGADFAETAGGLEVMVLWEKLSAVLEVQSRAQFFGSLEVEIVDLGGGLKGVAELPDTVIEFHEELTPKIIVPAVLEVFPNDRKTFSAQGILRSGEGATSLVVEGVFEAEDGSGSQQILATLPVEVGASRDEAVVTWPVSTFGIRPGTFTGQFRPVNDHAMAPRVEGAASDVGLSLLLAEIDGFDPPAASRGQILRALGRGFIPADAGLGQSMFFLLDGSFQTRGGTVIDFSGESAVQVAPESVDQHTEAALVLRSVVEDRGGISTLVGLTAAPGTFQGSVTPVLVQGQAVVRGRPYVGTLEVAPTRQVVFVRFLPNFSEVLDTFGLRNVEPEIRARIFDVLERDYAGVNIGFADVRPDAFVEYSIIEVGGPDPNGAGLFGLDNSAGKDTGNIRLNDIIGSENAESGELGFYVFGGVFIESFTTFSPSLDPGSEIASPAFDTALAPFMPSLGGVGVVASEWPEGNRVPEIEHAIGVMGSLVGNTITHEIGHSLGMSFFQEDLFTETTRFHNDFDEEGAIMDGGQNRPFEERAEIEGAPTPRFNVRNAAYLQTILPLP